MPDKSCKKCKYFQPIQSPKSRYMTIKCPYKTPSIIDSGNISFSKTQASLWFEILPDDCEYYSPVE